VLLALVIVAAVAGAVALCVLLAAGLWHTSRAECQRLAYVPRLINPPRGARRR